MMPQVNSALLVSVEVTSTSPLTIQYVINPSAVWSDGVPFSAADFVYAWQSQSGDGVDVDGQPDQVASTLGYRDVSSVTPSHGGKTVTVVFSTPFTDWRVMFNDMVPAHIASRVGWNHGFDTFNPAVDLSAGPLIVKSVSPAGTAVLVRNPKWWGVPGGRQGDGECGTRSGHLDQGAERRQSDRRPTDQVRPRLARNRVLAPEHPECGQLLVRSPRAGLQRQRSGDVPDRRRPTAIAHAINRTDLLLQTFGTIDPALVVNQDHLAVASQSGYNQSSASGEYSIADLTATDRLMKSIGYHKDPQGNYVDGAGARLMVRMAVESGDPWINQVAGEITTQLLRAGFDLVTVPVDGTEGWRRRPPPTPTTWPW